VAGTTYRTRHAGSSLLPIRCAAASKLSAALNQEIRFCSASDGVRLAYAKHGAGPPLVKASNWLTHLEFDWESGIWGHWLEELGRTNTVIRYDQRGCGMSDRDVGELSLKRWALDLETVIDAAGLEHFSLLGISGGAAVALAYAAHNPTRVERIVAYGGWASGRFLRRRPVQGRASGSGRRPVRAAAHAGVSKSLATRGRAGVAGLHRGGA